MRDEFFKIPTYKTIGGHTADKLINNAEIIKTRSNDYYFRVGDLDLDLTDGYELVVAGRGIGIGVMELDRNQQDKMIAVRQEIESLYQRDQAGMWQ